MKNTLRHSLLLLLTAAIWGFAFVAQSVGMDYVQPFTFTAARSLIRGSYCFRLFLSGRRKPAGLLRKNPLPGNRHCPEASSAVFCCVSHRTCNRSVSIYDSWKKRIYHSNVHRARSGTRYIFHKKTGIRVWISVALAVCGLYLLCMTGGSFRLQRGDLYTLCCALMFSCRFLPWITMHRLRIMRYWHASNFSPVASVP